MQTEELFCYLLKVEDVYNIQLHTVRPSITPSTLP